MRKFVFLCFIGLFLLTAANAWAIPIDTTSYELGFGNLALSGYAGPYATVDVSLDDTGSIATITFTGDTVNVGSYSYQYLFGGQGAAGVNVNATSWSLGTINGYNSPSGLPPGDYSDDGAANEDGFGKFNQTIDSFDGYTHSAEEITFSLTNNSGTWSTADNVLTGNSNGYLAAAHIFVALQNPDGSLSNCAVVTGYAANGTAPVPEPATLLLLGTGLVGLAGFTRKKFKKS